MCMNEEEGVDVVIKSALSGALLAHWTAEADATISAVKQELSTRIGIAPQRIALSYETIILTDGCTLRECGLSTAVAMSMLIRRERLALSGDQDGQLKIWDLDVAGSKLTFSAHEGSIKTMVADWDDMLAVSGGADNMIKSWNLNTGECLQTFAGHADVIRAVVVDWNGRQLLSASQDGCMKLWDLGRGACLHTFTGTTSHALSIAADWQGKQVLCSYQSGTLNLWDLDSKLCMRAFVGHPRHVLAMVCDWDGRQVLSGGLDCRLKLWNLDSAECLRTFVVRLRERKGDGVCAIAADWTDRKAVSCLVREAIVKIWHLDRGDCLHIFESGGNPMMSISFSPDCTQALVGFCNRCVKLWNLTDGSLCTQMPHGDAGPLLALSSAWR